MAKYIKQHICDHFGCVYIKSFERIIDHFTADIIVGKSVRTIHGHIDDEMNVYFD